MSVETPIATMIARSNALRHARDVARCLGFIGRTATAIRGVLVIATPMAGGCARSDALGLGLKWTSYGTSKRPAEALVGEVSVATANKIDGLTRGTPDGGSFVVEPIPANPLPGTIRIIGIGNDNAIAWWNAPLDR